MALLAQINNRFVDLAQKLNEVGKQAISVALQATHALNAAAHTQPLPELGVLSGSRLAVSPSMPLLAGSLVGESASGTELDLPQSLRNAEMFAPFPASTPYAPPGPANSQPIVQIASLQHIPPAPSMSRVAPPSQNMFQGRTNGP